MLKRCLALSLALASCTSAVTPLPRDAGEERGPAEVCIPDTPSPNPCTPDFPQHYRCPGHYIRPDAGYLACVAPRPSQEVAGGVVFEVCCVQ